MAASVPFSDFSSDPLSSDFPCGGDMLTCSSGGDVPQGELGRRSGAFACPRHHVPCLLAMSSGRRAEVMVAGGRSGTRCGGPAS
jgi:hypothetical protein